MQRENAIYKEGAGLSFSVVSALKGYKTSLHKESQYSRVLPDSPNCTLSHRKVDVKVLGNVLETGRVGSWGDGSVGPAIAVKVFTPRFKSRLCKKLGMTVCARYPSSRWAEEH